MCSFSNTSTVFDICKHVNELSFFFGTSQRVNTAPHRAHQTHANIVSGVAHAAEQAPARFICVRLEKIVRRFRVSCLTRSRYGLTSRNFFFRSTVPVCCILLIVMNNHTIHGQKDGLVDWPWKIFSQVVSPTPLLRLAVQRLLPFSYHQGEEVSIQ